MGKVLLKFFLFNKMIACVSKSCSFSRRILWLEVGTTNNDPKVIAGYHLEGVRKLRGMFVIMMLVHISINNDTFITNLRCP